MSLSPSIHHDPSPSIVHEVNANRPANFLAKLYHALNEDANAKQAMYWSPDGFHLIVADPKLLETHVLPYHYKHCKFTSFCRQLNIYGFARVYPGRHFEDSNGAVLSNASVWAHPTLHRDSKTEELMAVKRRAPPRLFRNRRMLPHHQDGQYHRTHDVHWAGHHPYGDATFLPILDLRLPLNRQDRDRNHSDQVSNLTLDISNNMIRKQDLLESRHTLLRGSPRSDGSLRRDTHNSWHQGPEMCYEEASPMSIAAHAGEVPSPQQIIQAMAQSRVATQSTPTTPQMSPWKHSSWNDVSPAKSEMLGIRPENSTRNYQPVDRGMKSNSSFVGNQNVQSTAQYHATTNDKASGPRVGNMVLAQDLQYVIEPDTASFQPLIVPSYRDKPLPTPTHWPDQTTLIPSRLPYVVSVPPVGSNYAAVMQQQYPLTAKDIIGSFGTETLQPSYLGVSREIF